MTTPFPFVAGAVLTAAELNAITTLPINDQTASYTLVVGDVGKRVVMNVASANTVTVDDSIFGVGDTIFIANKGAGATTVTAGAGVTINSASGLVLVQNQSGQLVALSASSFLFVASDVTAAGGMTLISTTTLSGASVSLSAIPGTFKHLQLVVRNFLPATDNQAFAVRVNGDSNANRHFSVPSSTAPGGSAFNATVWNTNTIGTDNAVTETLIVWDIFDYTNTVTRKMGRAQFAYNGSITTTNINFELSHYYYNQTGAITSLDLLPSSGNFTSGTVLLYGIS
jgi:hypothetical protein